MDRKFVQVQRADGTTVVTDAAGALATIRPITRYVKMVAQPKAIQKKKRRRRREKTYGSFNLRPEHFATLRPAWPFLKGE